MRVLIGCERSGTIRDAFRRKGCDAWSVDLEPCEAAQEFHYQADVFSLADPDSFDLFIVHPECRYLSVSGIHWNSRRPDRTKQTDEALEFAKRCFTLCAKFKRAALENPVSIISTRIIEYSQRKQPSQKIQPYEFGEDASKGTCLWLWNLPRLRPTVRHAGRMVLHNGTQVERWGNQTDSGQNRLAPSESRSMDRARTYKGIAEAMADQWADPSKYGFLEYP